MSRVCHGCGKAVLPGEARYTAMEPEQVWHWQCHDNSVEALQEAFRRQDTIMGRAAAALELLKRRMR